MPEDLHNGMTTSILKNLTPGTFATGHMLVFTPKPYRLDTELRAEGEDKYLVGDVAGTATRYLVKMELRGLTGVVASIMGKGPARHTLLDHERARARVREVRRAYVPEGPALARRADRTALARALTQRLGDTRRSGRASRVAPSGSPALRPARAGSSLRGSRPGVWRGP